MTRGIFAEKSNKFKFAFWANALRGSVLRRFLFFVITVLEGTKIWYFFTKIHDNADDKYSMIKILAPSTVVVVINVG